MTPEERKLVNELFDRLATLEDAERDSEAERQIRDGLRQAPNAPYALVQTVLVQDEALKRANARIRDLEGGEAPAGNTSFLGSMRDGLSGTRESRSSVPSVRPDAGSPAAAPGTSSAWRAGAQPMSPGPAAAPAAPVGAPMGMGGSFLGTAASAAAGVIGGALLLGGIRSMMGHHSGAHAAFDPAAGGSSPSRADSGGGELSRQAGLDDIGRSPGASNTRDDGHGLLDDSGDDDDDDAAGADDLDDDDFDTDDGGDDDE